MATNYIGLACTMHDGAMAIVDSGGKLVFAEATERYLQNKRAWDCAPDQFLRLPALLREYCDPSGPLVVAKSWSPAYENSASHTPSPAAGTRAAAEAQAPPTRTWGQQSGERNRRAVAAASLGIQHVAMRQRRPLQIRGYDHHLCHAAAACYTSPFEEAVCAIVDGFGEVRSYNFYYYDRGTFRSLLPQGSTPGTSLGLFYSYLCQLCGFDPAAGEEWKVMGLAAYGKLHPRIYAVMARALKVDGLHFVGAALTEELERYRRPAEAPALAAADLAYTGQRFFFDRMSEILNKLFGLGLSNNLVFGGGCALNSSCNGQLLARTPFKHLHVWCAPADDGNAAGAALLAYREDNPGRRLPPRVPTPCLGSALSRETLANVRDYGGIAGFRELDGGEIVERCARHLAEGKIVGWAQGRAEFGPRALGNRSILADPRRLDIKELLNSRVKFREEFRPFAPSILHEHGPEYFEDYQESPYMERTLRFRPEAATKVPGVVHVDGTGRLQTVRREWNERYYALLCEFHRLTGVPLLLNTSFNIMGKPIIHSVEDALAVFYTSGLDVLVMDNCMIEKSPGLAKPDRALAAALPLVPEAG